MNDSQIKRVDLCWKHRKQLHTDCCCQNRAKKKTLVAILLDDSEAWSEQTCVFELPTWEKIICV